MTHATGFSLVELIITLLIAAILLGVGVPSLADSYRHFRADSNIQKIQQHLLFARSHAISYGARITVCPLDNNLCINQWQQGLTVFIDNGEYGKFEADDKILFQLEAFHHEDTVSYSRSAIRFLPTGLASGTNGTLRYCPGSADSPYSRAVIISNAGRIRLSQDKEIACQ